MNVPVVMIDADAVVTRPISGGDREIRRRFWRGFSPETIAAVLQIEQARVDAALFARVPARTERALQMPDQVSA